MPVHSSPSEDRSGLLLICSGRVTGKDLLYANDRLLAAAERVGVYGYAIVDFSAAKSLQISADQVRQIAAQDQRIAVLTAPGLHVAIVAPTDVVFGLSRMWEVFSRNTGWETMVVRTREEAEDWLRQASNFRSGAQGKEDQVAP